MERLLCIEHEQENNRTCDQVSPPTNCLYTQIKTYVLQESKTVHRKTKTIPPCVDDADNPQDIVDMFANKYSPLYNSLLSESEKVQQI